MSKPIVSVIVCTYNREQHLPICLQSLANQTVDKSMYEVIVINNNSTDNTKRIAEKFSTKYANFRVVKEHQQGLSYSRNRGYQEAHGEYVAYIDDDARADPRWIENILSFISRHPDVVAFGGPYRGFSVVEVPEWYKESYGALNLGVVERPIEQNEWISGTNMIFKRSILKEIGGFNTRVGMSGDTISYGEETNLLLKIKGKKYPIFYVPTIIVEHLTANYKLSLKWMLKAYYRSGHSGLEAFGLKRRPVRQLFVIMYLLLKGLLRFFFSKERHIKARILESFSLFVWNLGLTVRMFKG